MLINLCLELPEPKKKSIEQNDDSKAETRQETKKKDRASSFTTVLCLEFKNALALPRGNAS